MLGVMSDYCLTQAPTGEQAVLPDKGYLWNQTIDIPLSQCLALQSYFIPCDLQKLTMRLLQQFWCINSYITSPLSSVHQTQVSYFTLQKTILTDSTIFVLLVCFKTCCFLDNWFLLVNITFYSQWSVYQTPVAKLSLHWMLKKGNE